jgi:hypothetical protein
MKLQSFAGRCATEPAFEDPVMVEVRPQLADVCGGGEGQGKSNTTTK